MNKRYYCSEDGQIITIDKLHDIFTQYYCGLSPDAFDDYEPNEFPLFVLHCSTGNGTLRPIDDRYTDKVLYYDMKTGEICDKTRMKTLMFWYGYSDPTDDEIYEYFFTIEEEG